MTRPCLPQILLSLSLSLAPPLLGCSDAPRGEGDGGADAGDAAMDGSEPTEDGGADAGARDASDPPDAGEDAGAEDAGGGDAGASDAGTDAGAPDAGTDAGASDAGGDAGSPGSCEGADLRYCESPSDCTPVSCSCSCSGCGGFDYETVVRSGCTDEWYASRGCEPPTICLDVCCPETTVTCVDNQCGATTGSTM